MDLKALGKKLLKLGAPKIGLALGGPMGAIAAKVLADKIGADDESPDAIDAALSTFEGDSEAMRKLDRELNHEIDSALIKANENIALAQIDANTQAAKSDSLFVAGARPAAIWISVFGFGYHYLFQPLLNGVVVLLDGPVDAFPSVGVTELTTLLFGLLGLGFARSYEKGKGVARESFKWIRKRG